MTDDTMRAAFERHMSDDGKCPAAIERGQNGYYHLAATYSAFLTWQAAWSAALAHRDAAAVQEAKPYYGGDPAEPRDDSDRSYDRPVGYLPAYELSRLASGHDARLRSAKFGPSELDGDVPVYVDPVALAMQEAKPVAVPAGYALVPTVPTDEMLCALFGYWLDIKGNPKQRATAALEYQGMLDAAPSTATAHEPEAPAAQEPLASSRSTCRETPSRATSATAPMPCSSGVSRR